MDQLSTAETTQDIKVQESRAIPADDEGKTTNRIF
jgi:hypothetical protein